MLPVLPALALILGAWLSQEQRSPADSPLRRAGQRDRPGQLSRGAARWPWPRGECSGSPRAFRRKANWPICSPATPPSTRSPSATSSTSRRAPPECFVRSCLLIGAALFFGTLASWRLRRRNRAAAANAALALMMLVSLQCVHAALVTFSPMLSSRALSDALTKVYRPGDVIVVNGAYEDASTLNFYGHLPLHVLNSRENGNLYFGSLFPDSPAVFEDDASLRAPLARPRTRLSLYPAGPDSTACSGRPAIEPSPVAEAN